MDNYETGIYTDNPDDTLRYMQTTQPVDLWGYPKQEQDLVEVVRCKDCKHRPIKPDNYNPITTDGFALEFPDEKCPCQCSDGWYSEYPDDDWFCPNGERRSE